MNWARMCDMKRWRERDMESISCFLFGLGVRPKIFSCHCRFLSVKIFSLRLSVETFDVICLVASLRHRSLDGERKKILLTRSSLHSIDLILSDEHIHLSLLKKKIVDVKNDAFHRTNPRYLQLVVHLRSHLSLFVNLCLRHSQSHRTERHFSSLDMQHVSFGIVHLSNRFRYGHVESLQWFSPLQHAILFALGSSLRHLWMFDLSQLLSSSFLSFVSRRVLQGEISSLPSIVLYSHSRSIVVDLCVPSSSSLRRLIHPVAWRILLFDPLHTHHSRSVSHLNSLLVSSFVHHSDIHLDHSLHTSDCSSTDVGLGRCPTSTESTRFDGDQTNSSHRLGFGHVTFSYGDFSSLRYFQRISIHWHMPSLV